MFDDPFFGSSTTSNILPQRKPDISELQKLNGFAVVVSSYTERERTRIISARISTAEEEKRYEEWSRQFYS